MTKDDVKRILIVDDELRTQLHVRDLFRDTGVNFEVVVANTVEEGHAQLNKWAAEGHAADIVDCDDQIRFCGAGEAFIRRAMRWALTQDRNLRPRQYFLHSKSSAFPPAIQVRDYDPGRTLSATVLTYDARELYEIANFSKGTGVHNSVDCKGGRRRFQDYLNKKFGTTFPVTKTQADSITETLPKITAIEVKNMAEDGQYAPEFLLQRLDLLRLRRDFLPQAVWRISRGAGEPASCGFQRNVGGALAGCIAFDQADIARIHAQGKKAILLLDDFEPADTHLLSGADGVVLLGEGVEHLDAVVANHGIPALMQQSSELPLRIGEQNGKKHLTNSTGAFCLRAGDAATINWSPSDVAEENTGYLCEGALPIVQENFLDRFNPYHTILGWADEARKKHGGLFVKANADTPAQIRNAIRLGAEGVGLLRTEHMFSSPDRLNALQRGLLAGNDAERKKPFATLKIAQEKDFTEIFRTVAKLPHAFPITVRLLDAPPDQFLSPEQRSRLAARVGVDHLRGAPLACKTPGLYRMQEEAIFAAAKRARYYELIEIMVPLVHSVKELREIKTEAESVAAKYGMSGQYRLRAMIETVDAVKNAGDIAKEVSGISFGTNDLTSEVMGGIARDDHAKARVWMVNNDHVGKSPFYTLCSPVKTLMEEASNAARKANPGIDIGICGHHVAGDMASIEFCQRLGLDSISVPANPEHTIVSRIMAGRAAAMHPSAARREKWETATKSPPPQRWHLDLGKNWPVER